MGCGRGRTYLKANLSILQYHEVQHLFIAGFPLLNALEYGNTPVTKKLRYLLLYTLYNFIKQIFHLIF